MASKVSPLRLYHFAYPIEQWVDGSTWEAKRGTDFDCKPKSFVVSLQRAAAKIDMHVEVCVRGDSVTFRFKENASVAGG